MEAFIVFWQHLPEHLSPYFVEIGGVKLRFYGILYVLSFFIVYLLVSRRLKNEHVGYHQETIKNFFFWAVLGVVIGARLGYVLLYDMAHFAQHGAEVFLPYSRTPDGILKYTGISGMSYHGGVIGLVIVTIWFCRKKRINAWKFADFIVPAVPLGYTLGRLGNFANGELYGRPTSWAGGMYFPLDPLQQLRHPSQLYEAFFEGLVLFAILWVLRKKKVFHGFLAALYLIGYGSFRFLIEFVREPDPQLGFVLLGLTMGQILCLSMILVGGLIAYWKSKPHENFLRG